MMAGRMRFKPMRLGKAARVEPSIKHQLNKITGLNIKKT